MEGKPVGAIDAENVLDLGDAVGDGVAAGAVSRRMGEMSCQSRNAGHPAQACRRTAAPAELAKEVLKARKATEYAALLIAE